MAMAGNCRPSIASISELWPPSAPYDDFLLNQMLKNAARNLCGGCVSACRQEKCDLISKAVITYLGYAELFLNGSNCRLGRPAIVALTNSGFIPEFERVFLWCLHLFFFSVGF